MSSMLLLRDADVVIDPNRTVSGKKGDVISVPWIKSKELLAAGIARHVQGGPAPAVQPRETSAQPHVHVTENAPAPSSSPPQSDKRK